MFNENNSRYGNEYNKWKKTYSYIKRKPRLVTVTSDIISTPESKTIDLTKFYRHRDYFEIKKRQASVYAPIVEGLLIFTSDVKNVDNIAESNYIVRCNSVGGAFIVYAPNSPSIGTRFGVKNISTSIKIVTVSGNGKLLDEFITRDITVPYQWRIWQYNGSIWVEVDAGVNDMVFTAEKSSLYTAAINEIVLANPTGGTFQINAPASPIKDNRFGVKNNSNSTNIITIDGNGNNIDDSTYQTMTVGNYEWRIYQFDGYQWRELSGGGKELELTSTKITDYTVVTGYRAVFDPSGGSFTIYAPAAPSINNEFGTKNITSNTTSITIDGNGNNLDGSATKTSDQPYEWRTWKYNGTQWNEIGD